MVPPRYIDEKVERCKGAMGVYGGFNTILHP
jgi:hypothetical protein